jgi:hypothetical protein
MKNIIKTVAELSLAITKHCSGFGDHPAKDVADVRFSKLTAEDVALLNDFSLKNSEFYTLVDPTIDIFIALMGLEESTIDQPFVQFNDKSYVARNNVYNRTRTESRIGPVKTPKTYSNMMMRGLWALNCQDPWVVDVFGQAVSLQHRCKAAILALLVGAKLPPIVLCLGVPKQFKDLADKAKSRSKIDDNFTDKTLMPQALVNYVELTVGGELTAPKNVDKTRKDLIKLRSTVCGMLANRINGKDVGTTGEKQDFDAESAIAELFGIVELESVEIPTQEGAPPIVVEGGNFLALDWLCCRVYEAGKSGDGKQAKSHLGLFANTIITTALALASNDEKRIAAIVNDTVQRIDGETIEEHSQRVLSAREEILSGGLTIDIALADKVLEELTTTTIETKGNEVVSFGGPLGEILKSLFEFNNSAKAKVTEKKLIYAATSIPAMSAMVQLVKGIESDTLQDVQTKYGQRDGKYSPEYRAFGGLDVGYLDRKDRKKAE